MGEAGAAEGLPCLQITVGEPRVLWLSGLHVPEAYLTALVQATCRKNKWPLDHSTLYTEVTRYRTAEDVTEGPTQGRGVNGSLAKIMKWFTGERGRNCLV